MTRATLRTYSHVRYIDRIAHALSNWKKEESIVVALFGNWGTGKSWLLHRVTAQIQKESSFIVCNFNPWQFESNEQITSEFFTAILEILPKDDSPNHQQRAQLWATLGALVSVAKIGTTVASITNSEIAAVHPALCGIQKLLKIGEDAAFAAEQQTNRTSQKFENPFLNYLKKRMPQRFW